MPGCFIKVQRQLVSILGACVFAASYSLPTAFAQTATLEEITVTARKRAESLQATPVAVTAISATDIKAAAFEDLSSIDRITPNLWFQGGSRSGGTANNAQVFIRGIGQFDFIPTADPGVGTYIDGVYLGRAVGGVLNLLDIEQVEILRGPQGTLFGRNTIGGAINVTSTRPLFNSNTGFLEFKAGNDDWLEGSGSANLAISDTAAARLSFNIKDRDGYGTSNIEPEIDFGNDDNLTLRGAFRWQFTDEFEANLTADYYHQNQNSTPSNASAFTGAGLMALQSGLALFGIIPGPPSFIPGGPPGSPPAFVTPNTLFPEDSAESSKNGPSRDNADIWGVSLMLDWDAFSWSAIKSITAYRDMDMHFIDDNDGYFLEVASTDEQLDQWQFSQEIQLNGEFEKLTWVTGVYYFTEKVTSNNIVQILPGLVQALEAFPAPVFPVAPGSVCPGTFPPNICAGGAGNPFNLILDNNIVTYNQIDVENIAFYSQGTYRLSEQWSVTAGFRLTHESKDLDRSQLLPDSSAVLKFPFFSVPPQTFSDNWTDFSPKVGIEFQPSDDLLLYVSFSEGFRSGTFNGRGGAPEAIATSVEPELVTTYEVGFKSEFMNRQARLNASLYYNDYEDLQIQTVQATSTGGFSVYLLNAATAEIWGGEAELTVIPHPQFTLSSSLGYTDAKIESIDPLVAATSGVADGALLRKTPEWTAHISGSYTQPTAYGNIDIRVTWSWRDEIYHNADNNPLSKEDALGLLDARAGLTTDNGKWEFAVFGTNLTNEFHFNDIFLPGVSQRVNYWARDRQYGGSIRFNF